MDKDRLKGVGEMTGDASLEAEGHVDKAKGKVQQGVGEAKDKVRDSVDGKDRI